MPRRRLAPTVPLVYVDSCVYLDLVTKNTTPHADSGEERWKSAKLTFDAINSDRVKLAASALIEAEVCCHGDARRTDSPDVRKLIEGWFTAPSTVWTDVDRYLARDAAALAKEHADNREDHRKSFGGADATHLAAAVRLGCDYLLTHDGGFPLGHIIEGVQIMRPAVVWPETLFDQAASS